jgi:MFS family permease
MADSPPDSSPPQLKTLLATTNSPLDESKHIEEGTLISTRLPSASLSLDPAAERRLVWKFDLRILPILAIMYLFNSLDKSNLGNAKTAGLEKTLGLKGNQYNIVLSVFFVPYVLTAPVLGILGKKYGPSRVLPVMMFCFGFITLMVVAVKNFGGLMAIRWFLGMSESAFFPLVIYYQTTFYRRGELARRLALFYAAQSIASAFGGLLAFGVFHIKTGAIANWRYLFVIEGSCTVAFSGFAYWYLPYSAAEASFLTEEEKKIAFHRMQVDSSSVVNEKFNFKDSVKIFKHPTSWLILGKPHIFSSQRSLFPISFPTINKTFQQSKSASASPSNQPSSSSPSSSPASAIQR